jgi:hypothetical protein
MTIHPERLARWVSEARTKLAAGQLIAQDLDDLLAAATPARQRLLYLHALHPTIHAEVVSWALHEPDDSGHTQISATGAGWPYDDVHAAIRDGWQVVHFPLQAAPFSDRELDVIGYEFILQKMEATHG